MVLFVFLAKVERRQQHCSVGTREVFRVSLQLWFSVRQISYSICKCGCGCSWYFVGAVRIFLSFCTLGRDILLFRLFVAVAVALQKSKGEAGMFDPFSPLICRGVSDGYLKKNCTVLSVHNINFSFFIIPILVPFLCLTDGSSQGTYTYIIAGDDRDRARHLRR